ncbi:SufD family Fe-S cluster assembly protein [Sandarakinorhabdus sp.]|uniref:SufD family Fe-S cluster assembly protein n=1 Tax=Sandarakinorhabdus sp. TaxID=1916663 RepID=UPI0033404DFB
MPNRKDEAWRWSNLTALSAAWPDAQVRSRSLDVAAGSHGRLDDVLAGDGWINDDVTVTVAADGRLDGIIRQDAAGMATMLYRITLEAGASAHLVILNHGSDLGRIALDVTLHAGADFQLGAILIGTAAQTSELVTIVRHVGPAATSNQIVRAVAGGTATTSYLGQVAVARAGQKTDASQSFKALLLNRGATANAKPELEIFADDVKCAHGATVGEIDANALFYLTSRGVPPVQARALLMRAFLSDALAGLDDTATETLEAEITALLATTA